MTRTDEPTGTLVTAALEKLAERRVSGILEIDGNPAGTIYLNQGQITFARASWIPDLSARLIGALRQSAASRDLIVEPDRPDRDIGTVLVQRNYLSRDDLQAILCSVIVDAALVLMVPTDKDAFVSDIRFAAPGAHWAGAFSSLCLDFVLSEAVRRAERVARYNLTRTTPVRLHDLRPPSAVLTREQWAIACAVDGAQSVQDLAWRCGLALYEAFECVGRLIQEGVCARCAGPAPAEPPGPLAQWFGRDQPPALSPTAVLSPTQVIPGLTAPGAAETTAGDPGPGRTARLPHRLPEAGNPQPRPVMSTEDWAAGTEPPGGDFTPAQPELLRRVLDGLRRLG